MEKGKSKIHKPLKGTVFLLRDFTTQLTKNYIKKDLSIKFNDNRIRNCTEREKERETIELDGKFINSFRTLCVKIIR